MIARIDKTNQPLSWRDELKLAYRDPEQMLRDLGLSSIELPLSKKIDFPFRVPRPFVAKMRHGDPQDPLLRQVLPLAAEDSRPPQFTADPNEELRFQRQPGLLQKYHGRALVITTGGCAINCRYCFRRNFPYQQAVGQAQWRDIIGALAADSAISEVILSGGDPLLLSDQAFADLLSELDSIPHLTRIRIHTRLPVTIPARLTDTLSETLAKSRFNIALVTHINHPNEIDPLLVDGLRRLHQSGINLFNQAVLLHGVNDDSGVLSRLCETLFQGHVVPYYIHLLDRVTGSAHFEVSLAKARDLEKKLRCLLPGYLMPEFVKEIPAMGSKTPLNLL